MTDLEITKLCAEAMSLQCPTCKFVCEDVLLKYAPLHDDAQAMALVKKLMLSVQYCETDDDQPYWSVYDCDGVLLSESVEADLNRAICEYVAKMQLSKEKV